MTNPNLNTYELTPEDNATLDAQIEAIRNDKTNSSRNDENYLNHVRNRYANLLINRKSTVTLIIPLSLAEYLAGNSRDIDPETAHTFKQLAQEQAGIELY